MDNTNNDGATDAAGTATEQASPGVSMGRWIPIDQLKTAPPFTNLFQIRQDKAEAITSSMRSSGFHAEHPIVVWTEKDVVVDGHTRLQAARNAGLERVPVVPRTFISENEALEYAISAQRNRRSLSDAEIMKCVEELHKRHGHANQHTAVRNVADSEGDRRKRSSAAQTAEILGVSQRKVEEMLTVVEHATPEIKDAVRRGEISGHAAYGSTQAARRAADPEPQSAPMNADVSTDISDPLNVRAADTGQPKPTAMDSTTAGTEVGPTAERVLKVVVGVLNNAAPTSTPAVLKGLIAQALGAQFPSFTAGMGHLLATTTARTPRRGVTV